MTFKTIDGREFTTKDLLNKDLVERLPSYFSEAVRNQTEKDWDNYLEIRNEILRRTGEQI